MIPAGADAAEAIDRGTEAAQALPRAEEFVTALHMLARESARGPILEEFEDDYARISRVGPREVWFESTGGEEVGPLVVPRRVSDLAQVGWNVSALLLVRTSKGWRVVEIGNVYPI